VQRFEGKTVLVTGASSGIGCATASRLALEGARIIAVARERVRLEQAAAEWSHPERHLVMNFDAGSEEAVELATAELRAKSGPLDAAVLCAGRHGLRPLQVAKSIHMDEMIAANIKSTLLCTKAFARCSNPGGGAVVWFSSAAALIGNPGEVLYAAAKGALISACRAVAVELAARRIRVNVVAPGVVETPMSGAWLGRLTPEQKEAIRARHLLGFGSPDDIAGVAAFLASDDARWITGTCLVADGGLTCH
jgi:NAD(P)-dependent dehydrogenase (short-subunit alcohol dehydrogenase family)